MKTLTDRNKSQFGKKKYIEIWFPLSWPMMNLVGISIYSNYCFFRWNSEIVKTLFSLFI